jgi:Methyltransferase domain
MIHRFASALPWWGKIGAKIVLSRIPVAYTFWSKVGAFRHGANDNAEYAYNVFRTHFLRVAPPAGFVTLELGPGDALGSAILTKAFGGSASHQIDVGDYATKDLEPYKRIAALCRAHGHQVPPIETACCREEVLHMCNASYGVNGFLSLREIPDNTVDFIYSQSCLEHVRRKDFAPTMVELRRVLKRGAAGSHWVDLQDHLAHALNNLRFSEKTWESPFMAEAGFYTNRIRFA